MAEVAEEAEEGALLPGGALGGSMSAGSPPLLCLLLQLDQRKAAALLGLLVKRCACTCTRTRTCSLARSTRKATPHRTHRPPRTPRTHRTHRTHRTLPPRRPPRVAGCSATAGRRGGCRSGSTRPWRHSTRTSSMQVRVTSRTQPNPNPNLNPNPNPNADTIDADTASLLRALVRSCMALRSKLGRKVAAAAAAAAAAVQGDGEGGGGDGGGGAAAAQAQAERRAAALNVLLGLAGGFFGQASAEELGRGSLDGDEQTDEQTDDLGYGDVDCYGAKVEVRTPQLPDAAEAHRASAAAAAATSGGSEQLAVAGDNRLIFVDPDE